jgi:hypothetical protein
VSGCCSKAATAALGRPILGYEGVCGTLVFVWLGVVLDGSFRVGLLLRCSYGGFGSPDRPWWLVPVHWALTHWDTLGPFRQKSQGADLGGYLFWNMFCILSYDAFFWEQLSGNIALGASSGAQLWKFQKQSSAASAVRTTSQDSLRQTFDKQKFVSTRGLLFLTGPPFLCCCSCWTTTWTSSSSAFWQFNWRSAQMEA